MVTVDQYLARITSEHANQPLFRQMVAEACQPYVDLQNLYAEMFLKYDLDLSVGSQLDAVGLWIGISRELAIPLTGVFFSFDTVGLGWDQGNWLGPDETGDVMYLLDDDDYRLVLRARIAVNYWTGKAGSTAAVLEFAFAPLGYTLLIQDNQNMTITIYVIGPPLTAVQTALLLGGQLSLKSAGVGITGYYFITGPPIFGFDLETPVVAGWDSGKWAPPAV